METPIRSGYVYFALRGDFVLAATQLLLKGMSFPDRPHALSVALSQSAHTASHISAPGRLTPDRLADKRFVQQPEVWPAYNFVAPPPFYPCLQPPWARTASHSLSASSVRLHPPGPIYSNTEHSLYFFKSQTRAWRSVQLALPPFPGELKLCTQIPIGERAPLAEFPSRLLPAGVTTGSIVNIAVPRNHAEEKRQSDDFWALQDEICALLGRSSRRRPSLRCALEFVQCR